ncbi:kinase-like protein [Byssothecium circinans]|uniref:Kinase-like protein n=1 Tax=Byssothecium circinans TaxID=147558 RepID=A0A6A5TUC4_9PLEO|nr:kinase-like protein [Byssothecium circinans]
MLLALPLLLASVPFAHSQLPIGAEFKCHKSSQKWTDESWAQAKKNVEKNGHCLYYETGEPGFDVSTCGSQCGKGVEASGCMASGTEGFPGPDGRCFYPGKCICPKDVEWVGDLIADIVQGLNEFFQNIVDAFVCGGILDAILMTVDIGLSLIPGGAFASAAMRTGIRVAKSVSEAGSDRSAFEEWFGAQCGSKPSDVDKVWKEWTGVPDSELPSFPGGECLKSKKKKGCKSKPSEDDDKKEEERRKKQFEEDRNKTSKKPTSKPTTNPQTKTTQQTTTKASTASETKTTPKTSTKATTAPETKTTQKSSTKLTATDTKTTPNASTKTAPTPDTKTTSKATTKATTAPETKTTQKTTTQATTTPDETNHRSNKTLTATSRTTGKTDSTTATTLTSLRSSASACTRTPKTKRSIPTLTPQLLHKRANRKPFECIYDDEEYEPGNPPEGAVQDDDAKNPLGCYTCGKTGRKRNFLGMQTVNAHQFGFGAEGRVVQAWLPTGQEVAVKQSTSAEQSKKMVEIQTSLSSKSEKIAKVFFSCNEYAEHWTVMEYFPSGSLMSRIESGVLEGNEGAIKKVMDQVLEGIAFMHSEGYAHTDIKADNFMMNGDVVKVIDLDGATQDKKQTAFGKDSYLSPEAKQGKDTDPKANDVWALGMMHVDVARKGKAWADAMAPEAKSLWQAKSKSIRVDECKKLWKEFSRQHCELLADVFVEEKDRIDAAKFRDTLKRIPLFGECD